MGKNYEDITGKQFGYWTVLGRDKDRASHWSCRCECGTVKGVLKYDLTHGTSKSCGCHRYDRQKIKRGGMKDHRLYTVWRGMKQRCYGKTSDSYKNYGARGVKICDEWLNDFYSFLDWAVKTGYDESLPVRLQSIDRIDVNGDYCPENCRWATASEQAYNKRPKLVLTYNGKTMSAREWSKETGLKYATIVKRKQDGFTDEEALTIPLRKKRRKNG